MRAPCCVSGTAAEVMASLREGDGSPNPHAVRILGDPLIERTGPHGPRIAVVLSTDHLLLNAYRARASGAPVQLMCDSEYSLVTEGYATFLVGVSSLDQQFHIIAYALMSRENRGLYEVVFRVIKAAVEAAVKKYAGKWV